MSSPRRGGPRAPGRTDAPTSDPVISLLAPSGTLRVGISLQDAWLASRGVNPEARDPEGVAPELARILARDLGRAGGVDIDTEFVIFDSPGELFAAADTDVWDVGIFAADSAMLTKIALSDPFCELPATFAVMADGERDDRLTASTIDRLGVRIASADGAWYSSWLEKHLERALLVRVGSLEAGLALVRAGEADAVAGEAGALLSLIGADAELRVLEGAFAAVPQAIGVPLRKGPRIPHIVRLLRDFVRSQLVAGAGQDSGTAVSALLTRSAAAAALRPAALPAPPLRVTVLGCGAMGSIYAALFASAGNYVRAVDVWSPHVEKMRLSGLRVEGASGERTVFLEHVCSDARDLLAILTAVDDTSGQEGLETPLPHLIIVATKAAQVPEALVAAKALLDEGGCPLSGLLLIQNGISVGREALRSELGVHAGLAMLGVASNFGACMKGPAHAEHKSMNLICFGALEPELPAGEARADPAGGARLALFEAAWRGAGFTVATSPDIHTQIWEKLICNCAFSATSAVTGFTVGQILDTPPARSLALACAREAAAVARAKGIRILERELRGSGRDQASDEDVDSYVLKFGSTLRGARPSMLQDHAAQRRCEIDAINGAIPREAASVGLAAPVNQSLADVVRAREAVFGDA